MTMTKKQFRNLYHSYRFFIRRNTRDQALAWIAFYNEEDRRIIERVIGQADNPHAGEPTKTR